ncbi:MAG TPA: cupredoxin domain-containing protein [Candidatus Paceibacterota bacterium]|jgi:plastocyanin domain-containing protein|nr:cupredoxin domain-containing protein [Candidatus Paceibacterota bacterium]
MKVTIISILVAVVLIGGAFMLTKGKSESKAATPVNNVSMVDGKQIITINAKGGYQPTNSIAKAGVPTVIRFDTKGTFDCSSSIRIPSMNITKVLPQTGTTDIDIGTPEVATLQGTCGMGMYPFAITFQG